MTAEPPTAALAEPRPGKLLVALSVLVIGGCLLAASVSLAFGFAPHGECSTDQLSALLLIPLQMFLGIQQYRGVFHRQAGAAFATACCFVGFGALFLLASLGNAVQFVLDGQRPNVNWGEDWPLFCFLVGIGLVGLFNVSLGWQTMQWSKELRAAGQGSGSRTFSLLEIVVIASLIGGVAGVASITFERPPSTGVNVPPDQAPFSVPSTARDVCYQMFSSSCGVVEFTTDEPTFRQWIAEVVAPAAWDRAEVAPLEKKAESAIRDYRGKSWLATDVLQYSWSFEGNGAVANFDPATGRAYYTRYRD